MRIIEQVAKALHAAHQVGLVHRDVKPSNILLDDDDFAYLIDFGIARAIDDTRLTKSGDTIGTFQYMAPERLGRPGTRGRPRRHLLAGLRAVRMPDRPAAVSRATMAQLVAAHLNTPPPRPSTTRPDVPAQVDEVIATGMAKDPDQRYATTIELANAARDAITAPIAQRPDVSEACRPQPRETPPHRRTRDDEPSEPAPTPRWRPRRPALIGVAIVVLLAGAGAGGYLLRPHPSASHAATLSGPTARPAPPPSRPPVPATGLADLLLSPNNLAAALGAGDMSVTGTYTDMVTDTTTDQACVGVVRMGSAAVYASGHTGVRGQVVIERPNYVVVQYVVSLRSAHDASAIFTAATQQWPACSGRPISVQTPGFESKIETIGPVSNANGSLTATITSSVDPVLCERALTVANNVAIDIAACGRPGAAINIAHQIAAKVPA